MPLDVLHDPGFVAIDVETTGLDPRRDQLVAVAALPFVGGAVRAGLVTLVRPGRPIPPAATAVHGLRDDDVADAPEVAVVLATLDTACAGQIVVGHDVAFDLGVIGAARAAHGFTRWDVLALCTRRLARAADPHVRDSRLESVAAALGVSTAGRHTPDGDARMAGEILLALLPTLRARGARTVADLLRLQRAAGTYD
jgi:DNA polymerase III epsilon subunit-like protein